MEVEEPVLSETHGLGEPTQAGGYLTTRARREHVRKHGPIREKEFQISQGNGRIGAMRRGVQGKIIETHLGTKKQITNNLKVSWDEAKK